MRLRISNTYLSALSNGNEFILDAITASVIVKATYRDSSIHSFSLNKFQELLGTSFKKAKETYANVMKLGLAKEVKNGNRKDLIFTNLVKKHHSGYSYVYAHVDENGVCLYNYADENTIIEKGPQTFKEAKNVLLELAVCMKISLYNKKAAETDDACCGEKNYEEVSAEDMAKRQDASYGFYAGWSQFLIKTGKITPESKWRIPAETKDDKIKHEEQRQTRPIALSYISKYLLNGNQSISTVKRLVKHATENGLLKKYDNGRILVYYETDSSDYVHVDPRTSYHFDKNGQPTKNVFRINKREIKINGDLKKSGSTEPKCTEAWKQPDMNSYAVRAIGILDGLAKQVRAAAYTNMIA